MSGKDIWGSIWYITLSYISIFQIAYLQMLDSFWSILKYFEVIMSSEYIILGKLMPWLKHHAFLIALNYLIMNKYWRPKDKSISFEGTSVFDWVRKLYPGLRFF